MHRITRGAFAALLGLAIPLAVQAQAGLAAGGPGPSSGVGASHPQRVPDRVWSTQPSSVPVQTSGGVVVMTPNVVLGWGGRPPSGPLPPQGPGVIGPAPLPGQWRQVPGQPPGVAPPPGSLHPWRTP